MSIFIVTCGPTGIGKTFQMQRLINLDRRRFTAVQSVTTRPRRGPEDGEWYRFISHDDIKKINKDDIVSEMTFRGEKYLTLCSEVDKACARAPIVFMAIVPSVIILLRQKKIMHSLVCCRVGDEKKYEERLKRRGFSGEALEQERIAGLAFDYPQFQDGWPQTDVLFKSDDGDNELFIQTVAKLAGNLFPKVLLDKKE